MPGDAAGLGQDASGEPLVGDGEPVAIQIGQQEAEPVGGMNGPGGAGVMQGGQVLDEPAPAAPSGAEYALEVDES